MMGAPNLISDNLDCGLSYSVISYLKKLSQQVVLIKPLPLEVRCYLVCGNLITKQLIPVGVHMGVQPN